MSFPPNEDPSSKRKRRVKKKRSSSGHRPWISNTPSRNCISLKPRHQQPFIPSETSVYQLAVKDGNPLRSPKRVPSRAEANRVYNIDARNKSEKTESRFKGWNHIKSRKKSQNIIEEPVGLFNTLGCVETHQRRFEPQKHYNKNKPAQEDGVWVSSADYVGVADYIRNHDQQLGVPVNTEKDVPQSASRSSRDDEKRRRLYEERESKYKTSGRDLDIDACLMENVYVNTRSKESSVTGLGIADQSPWSRSHTKSGHHHSRKSTHRHRKDYPWEITHAVQEIYEVQSGDKDPTRLPSHKSQYYSNEDQRTELRADKNRDFENYEMREVSPPIEQMQSRSTKETRSRLPPERFTTRSSNEKRTALPAEEIQYRSFNEKHAKEVIQHYPHAASHSVKREATDTEHSSRTSCNAASVNVTLLTFGIPNVESNNEMKNNHGFAANDLANPEFNKIIGQLTQYLIQRQGHLNLPESQNHVLVETVLHNNGDQFDKKDVDGDRLRLEEIERQKIIGWNNETSETIVNSQFPGKNQYRTQTYRTAVDTTSPYKNKHKSGARNLSPKASEANFIKQRSGNQDYRSVEDGAQRSRHSRHKSKRMESSPATSNTVLYHLEASKFKGFNKKSSHSGSRTKLKSKTGSNNDLKSGKNYKQYKDKYIEGNVSVTNLAASRKSSRTKVKKSKKDREVFSKSSRDSISGSLVNLRPSSGPKMLKNVESYSNKKNASESKNSSKPSPKSKNLEESSSKQINMNLITQTKNPASDEQLSRKSSYPQGHLKNDKRSKKETEFTSSVDKNGDRSNRTANGTSSPKRRENEESIVIRIGGSDSQTSASQRRNHTGDQPQKAQSSAKRKTKPDSSVNQSGGKQANSRDYKPTNRPSSGSQSSTGILKVRNSSDQLVRKAGAERNTKSKHGRPKQKELGSHTSIVSQRNKKSRHGKQKDLGSQTSIASQRNKKSRQEKQKDLGSQTSIVSKRNKKPTYDKQKDLGSHTSLTSRARSLSERSLKGKSSGKQNKSKAGKQQKSPGSQSSQMDITHSRHSSDLIINRVQETKSSPKSKSKPSSAESLKQKRNTTTKSNSPSPRPSAKPVPEKSARNSKQKPVSPRGSSEKTVPDKSKRNSKREPVSPTSSREKTVPDKTKRNSKPQSVSSRGSSEKMLPDKSKRNSKREPVSPPSSSEKTLPDKSKRNTKQPVSPASSSEKTVPTKRNSKQKPVSPRGSSEKTLPDKSKRNSQRQPVSPTSSSEKTVPNKPARSTKQQPASSRGNTATDKKPGRRRSSTSPMEHQPSPTGIPQPRRRSVDSRPTREPGTGRAEVNVSPYSSNRRLGSDDEPVVMTSSRRARHPQTSCSDVCTSECSKSSANSDVIIKIEPERRGLSASSAETNEKRRERNEEILRQRKNEKSKQGGGCSSCSGASADNDDEYGKAGKAGKGGKAERDGKGGRDGKGRKGEAGGSDGKSRAGSRDENVRRRGSGGKDGGADRKSRGGNRGESMRDVSGGKDGQGQQGGRDGTSRGGSRRESMRDGSSGKIGQGQQDGRDGKSRGASRAGSVRDGSGGKDGKAQQGGRGGKSGGGSRGERRGSGVKGESDQQGRRDGSFRGDSNEPSQETLPGDSRSRKLSSKDGKAQKICANFKLQSTDELPDTKYLKQCFCLKDDPQGASKPNLLYGADLYCSCVPHRQSSSILSMRGIKSKGLGSSDSTIGDGTKRGPKEKVDPKNKGGQRRGSTGSVTKDKDAKRKSGIDDQKNKSGQRTGSNGSVTKGKDAKSKSGQRRGSNGSVTKDKDGKRKSGIDDQKNKSGQRPGSNESVTKGKDAKSKSGQRRGSNGSVTKDKDGRRKSGKDGDAKAKDIRSGKGPKKRSQGRLETKYPDKEPDRQDPTDSETDFRQRHIYEKVLHP